MNGEEKINMDSNRRKCWVAEKQPKIKTKNIYRILEF